MPHISSLAPLGFALLNGETSPNPYIAAVLNVGDRGCADRPVPEFGLWDVARRMAHARLTSTAEHARLVRSSPFFNVAPVRLEVNPNGECRLAVGTGDYVRLQA